MRAIGWLMVLMPSLFAADVQAAEPANLTVVELFTSQGCSSCPPANANLAVIGERPDVLALSFGVTYWDRLGWRDSFGRPAYTDRQWAYASGLGHDQVWTPQVVVNGRVDVVGTEKEEIEAAIRDAAPATPGPAVAIGEGAVTVAAGVASGEGADVWLVRYDPRVVEVPVHAGENAGRTLPHRYVVYELQRLGGWTGAAARYDIPPASDSRDRTAILVQRAHGGPILTAIRG